MKKFFHKNEIQTVESWLVKAIHEKIDFSLSLKNIPSETFMKTFRKKYEIEFMRLESESFNTLSDNRISNTGVGLALSSAHSSMYSQNLGRSISMAS